MDFGNKRSKESSTLVKSQSGLIVPPRTKKNSSGREFKETASTLVRTQSGQIVPPRVRRSSSNLRLRSVSPCPSGSSPRARVPPTPPKRKKHLQIEKINQLFMNFVDLNGQERMQKQQGKESTVDIFCNSGP